MELERAEAPLGSGHSLPSPAGRDSASTRNREIRAALEAAASWTLERQDPDGYWVGELEADTTVESYMVFFWHFLGRPDHPKVPAYARTIRKAMLSSGGWATHPGGPPDISVSVLAYLALKLAGIPEREPDMQRSRDIIRALGGPARARTYPKYHLAMFGQYDWRDVPAVPPEVIFLPRFFPISIYDMSSWSRAIFVPLSILYGNKPSIPVPPGRGVEELFPGGRDDAATSLPRGDSLVSWDRFFWEVDRALKLAERLPIGALRRAAMRKAEQWVARRAEAPGGLGAILPGITNSALALKSLGYPTSHPLIQKCIRDLEDLEIEDPADGSIRIQPCHSPVWDTAITTYALSQGDFDHRHPAIRKATRWLLDKQVTTSGDWQVNTGAPPGGWHFEFHNEFYPDVDDTAMVVTALRRAWPRGRDLEVDRAIRLGVRWVLGMQNRDGGWASFDRDNSLDLLNHVPFADFNALIDPSSADITGRILEMLTTVNATRFGRDHPVVGRALRYLDREQEDDGSWYGRWGVNYLYGTWQVLRGLGVSGEDPGSPRVRRAVRWILDHQHADGGWGEAPLSYEDPDLKGQGSSSASQTAWATMGLLAAGQGDSAAVQAGVRYLLENRGDDGSWEESSWTGTGFPQVFYMKYHLYQHYWPYMALAQFEAHRRGRRR